MNELTPEQDEYLRRTLRAITPDDEKLYGLIEDYQSLPQEQQKKLMGLLARTISRHRKLKATTEHLKEFFDRKDLKDLDQTCVWKRVANEDLEMRTRGERKSSFFSGKECYDCSGYDVDCDKYLGFYINKEDEK